MATIEAGSWSCPLPLRDHPNVVLGHGGGGKLSAELVRHLFVPAFHGEGAVELNDAAVLPAQPDRLAFSTDSFVVRPRFFPGGCIGDLAVHGTVNDLAMSGAEPLYMSASFIVEEGLAMEELARIAEAMGAAARNVGVALVTGDTKVVDRGHGDGLYVCTTGIGRIRSGVDIRPERCRPGDAVLVSGMLGDHGMAIMSVREGLAFEAAIESDSAPLHGLVQEILDAAGDVHALRDPTRGGAASTLNELAQSASLGIEIDESLLPVRPAVRAACEILGMDPLFVANEGKLVAVVPDADAEAVLERMRAHAYGRDAVRIGTVTADHPGIVVARTGIGGTRVVDMQVGEQLPRIC
jgi:hydrogenase expression/formation protein HypE